MATVLVLACVVLAPCPTRAEDCQYDLADVSAAPRFEHYPADAWPRHAPAAPVLASRRARLFRTVIRDAAANGPDFAGHYTVAVWGCGSACSQAAIVDSRTGRVFFSPDLDAISAIHVRGTEPDGRDPAYYTLRFRLGSRLLAVLGAPREDESVEGVRFYAWTGSSLKLVRFVPRAALCRTQ